MKPENFAKAERLFRLRKEIDDNAYHAYVVDDNHHGSNCKPEFKSKHIADAHEHLKKALECIGLELQEL